MTPRVVNVVGCRRVGALVSKNRRLSSSIVRCELVWKGTVPLSKENLSRELHSLNWEKSWIILSWTASQTWTEVSTFSLVFGPGRLWLGHCNFFRWKLYMTVQTAWKCGPNILRGLFTTLRKHAYSKTENFQIKNSNIFFIFLLKT